jgi:hypothetical protein
MDRFWLAGTLGRHRRGRVLQDAAGTGVSVVEPPEDHGLCVMFGTDFQGDDLEVQKTWANWSQVPGRALLLIPPLKIGACTEPVKWEVTGKASVDAKDSVELLQAIASEVRHELRGKLQTVAQLGGAWGDYAVNTAFYRRHPHAGIFVVTCLPLWSLSILDHRDALRQWLSELYKMAGTPAQAIEENDAFKPTVDHYAILLHLLRGQFLDRAAAISALKSSDIFALNPADADKLIAELGQQGLVSGAELTSGGREILLHSPYAPYAVEFEYLKKRNQ